jgi:predicted aldo/keto reductase-like oxidoreductase
MAAQKAGKIRYIGFTGHKDPAVHNGMLDVAAQHNFHFDVCQMTLNVLLSAAYCSHPDRGATPSISLRGALR